MKITALDIAIALSFALLVPSNLNADTIDYCNIFRNKNKVSEFNLSEHHEYVIKRNEILPADTFGIRLSTDMPCTKCATKLLVTDLNDSLVFSLSGNREGEIFKYEMQKFIAVSKLLKVTTFRLYHVLAQKRKYLTDLIISDE